MTLTDEPIALRQPDGALWRLVATLWLMPEDDETALAGQGDVGNTWPARVLEFLQGAQWGGFGSEDPEFPSDSSAPGPSTGSATFSLLDDSWPTYRVEVLSGLTQQTGSGLPRLVAIRGLGATPTALHDSPPAAPVPDGDQPEASVSPSSELVSSETSQAIRLRAIAVVERLTHEVEDTVETEHERAIARSVREYLTVLKAYVNDELSDELTTGILDHLRQLGATLRDLAGYVKLAELGIGILRLVREFG